jgi:CheY-like chemotaxis protein
MAISPAATQTSLRSAKLDIQNVLTKPLHQSQLYDAMVCAFCEPGSEERVRQSVHSSTKRSGAALRVLLAEDNVVNQRVAHLMLEKLGQGADVVSNGLEAVEAAMRLPYDIILMDMQMPEMDGLEATRRIRQAESMQRQPRIVAMTANVLQGDRERCLSAGMDDYISKPVKLEELARVLEQSKLRQTAKADVTEVQETTQTEYVCYDQGAVKELVSAVGQEAMVGIINTMIKDAPRLLSGLQKALANSDATELRQWAHQLKSNAMTVGAVALAQLLQELETIGASGSVSAAASKAVRAQADYRKLMSVLTKLADSPETV